MRLRRLLRQVHLVVGVGLSLVLLVLALSGTALVLKAPYWRAVYPELRGPARELGPEDHAAAAAGAMATFGPALRSVKLPEPGVPAYHLYLAGGEAFLSIDDHALIDVWGPSDRPMSILFDLHAHLMAGEAGESVAGVVSLLGVLLVGTGLVVWWPARRRFSPRNLLPRTLARRALLVSHRDLGLAATPILLVVLLTGAGIVFYGPARVALNALFGDVAPVEAAAPTAAPGARASSPTAAAFARVARVFPEARLVFYYPPTADAGVHGFRLRRPCELHPNGRSYLYLDATGSVVRAVDACAATPGDRAAHALYPLHAGKTGSTAYALLVALGGLALATVSATGAAAYLGKLVAPADPPGVSCRSRSRSRRPG